MLSEHKTYIYQLQLFVQLFVSGQAFKTYLIDLILLSDICFFNPVYNSISFQRHLYLTYRFANKTCRHSALYS